MDRPARAHCPGALVFLEHGQPDDPDLGELRVDQACRLDAVHARHVEIHQDHVGPPETGALHRRTAVRRLADHLDVRLAAQEGGKTLPYNHVVLHQQDADPAPTPTRRPRRSSRDRALACRLVVKITNSEDRSGSEKS
jgi:hypothetical protein